MTDKAVSRRRENAAFFLRILAFGLIFTLISCAVLYVLTPKYDYGPGSMMNLPLQPRNTIDVLAVGTSTTYAAVNTNVLWANWGFSVYDLASAEQQYWHTYYYLEQALTTQHPKILLLDEHTAALDPATAEKVLNLTKKIVSEQNITCLMVTHNMHQALELGNRTLMMDSGNIVLDVSGEEREKMSVDDLLEQFAVRAGKALDNDRILFSKVEA